MDDGLQFARAWIDPQVPGETLVSVVPARGSSPKIPTLPPTLGRYTVLGLRGCGGMGAVYEARDPELDRHVAIKVLREDRPNETDLLRREAQVLARLVHPNIVTVHDVGTADGRVYMVIQLVGGESIDRWARDKTGEQIVAAFHHAGRGLAAAHAAGIVHCDFKPANVLLDSDGTVRVSDFGIARIGDATDMVGGTPAYMAPEQFSGVATPASDQYAFCAALWEVLAREPLFATTALDDAIDQRRYRPLPRHARVPAHIERALERGVSADPDRRFPSMTALLAALAPRRRGWHLATACVGTLAVVAIVLAQREAPAGVIAAVADPQPRIPEPDVRDVRALTNLGDDGCAYAPAIVGDRVVFDRTDEGAVDLYAVPLAGGALRPLTSGRAWEWRAQPGRRPGEVLHLIHNPERTQGAAIASLDLATGVSTPEASVLANDALVAGDALFYIPNNQREVRRILHGRDEVFAQPPPGVNLVTFTRSPDGSQLAAQGLGHICLIATASGDISCLSARSRNRPAFGSDGRALYYASPRGIQRIDLATREDKLILPEVHAPGGLAVASDGKTLVLSDCGSQVKLVELGAKQRVVNDGPNVRDPALSRGGDLAWTRFKRGVHVLMLRTATGEQFQLTHPTLGDVRAPVFSPDGKQLAFVVAGPHPGLYVIRRQSGSTTGVFAESNPQRLTEDDTDDRPTWTTTGTIAFTRRDGRSYAVHAIPADGGPARKLATGRRVFGSRDHELVVASERMLYWFDPSTGEERPGPQLDETPTFLAVSPGGRWLAFAVGGAVGHTIWRKAIAGDAPAERVGEIATGQTMRELAIGDDGRVLATPTSWSGDLYAVPAPAGTRF